MHRTFTAWLGADYDLDAIDAVVAAAAAGRLGGDPAWLLIVGGPGNAKTETVTALRDSGAHIVSTIASEGALLSGTSQGERARDATGGLLRDIGETGVLVLKDFTSILSLPGTTRPGVLAALREIYDGRWSRSIGADGGRMLTWEGRLVVIGAVTTEWDQAHSAISSMGDRFMLLRMDSRENRLSAGRLAIANVGQETTMRTELADAVAAVLRQVNKRVDTAAVPLTVAHNERILEAADLVTFARTAVQRDRSGNVVDAHAPEMPTRFAKQLAQLARGAVAIGLAPDAAVSLAIRCARDSVPPLRLAILHDLAKHSNAPVTEISGRLQKPHNTVDRELQALHMLGLVTRNDVKGDKGTRWFYSVSERANPDAVPPNVSRNISTPPPPGRGLLTNPETPARGSTYKSGNARCVTPHCPKPRHGYAQYCEECLDQVRKEMKLENDKERRLEYADKLSATANSR